MKRGATKEEIIRTTLDLITRNGLRAVRVDEIAQMLGISKRTLYEMFADKNDLISACLNDMARQQRQHIDADRKRRSGNALQKTLRLVNTYVDSLYKVDPSFLSDIRHKIVFAEYYDEHREFWFRELTRDFDVCRNEGLLLAEIDSPFAGRTADRNAVRTATEQHLARRALHAQQDHPPGCRNAGRDRLDRPEAIAARRTTHARNPFPVIGNGFFCLQRQKKPLGRCVFVKNFYICVVEVSPMMKRSATYGFRQLPEAMPMMSMMSMRSRSGRA